MSPQACPGFDPLWSFFFPLTLDSFTSQATGPGINRSGSTETSDPLSPTTWHILDVPLPASISPIANIDHQYEDDEIPLHHCQTRPNQALVLAASQLEPTAANDSTNVDPVPTIGPSMRRILFQMIFTTDDHLIGQLPLSKPGATPFLARRQSTQVIRQGEEGKAKRT
ncbi:uncharacterized protein PG998_012204 [Apiospora kogelbergensis]|uniref:uncharacterized protein n=1 Tax=Apiospora kogelbergensis TaxID=1337665 RepID=UPI003130D152